MSEASVSGSNAERVHPLSTIDSPKAYQAKKWRGPGSAPKLGDLNDWLAVMGVSSHACCVRASTLDAFVTERKPLRGVGVCARDLGLVKAC